MRRDVAHTAHEDSGDPDLDRQQRQQVGSQQTHVVPLSSQRTPHGDGELYQEDGIKSAGRVGNSEADVVATGDVSSFGPTRRLTVDVDPIKWDILPDVEAKRLDLLPIRAKKQRKRLPHDRLRLKDPW